MGGQRHLHCINMYIYSGCNAKGGNYFLEVLQLKRDQIKNMQTQAVRRLSQQFELCYGLLYCTS